MIQSFKHENFCAIASYVGDEIAIQTKAVIVCLLQLSHKLHVGFIDKLGDALCKAA